MLVIFTRYIKNKHISQFIDIINWMLSLTCDARSGTSDIYLVRNLKLNKGTPYIFGFVKYIVHA